MTSEAPAAGDAAASDDAAVPPQSAIDDVAPLRYARADAAANATGGAANATVGAAPLPHGAAAGGVTTAEIGGRNGPEPTRYGDWEMRGRCIDF